MAARRAQGTIEYLLGVTVLLIALLYAARPGGPVYESISNLLSGTKNVTNSAVCDSARRLRLDEPKDAAGKPLPNPCKS